jgi:hypothetical protein
MLINLTPFGYKIVFMICISFGLFGYLRLAWKNNQKKLIQLQRLHQIPCSHCFFFTDEYNLKCAVHPGKALSEEAIGCADYQAAKVSSVNDPKI